MVESTRMIRPLPRASRPPYKTRLKMSIPALSVPNRCAPLGGRS